MLLAYSAISVVSICLLANIFLNYYMDSQLTFVGILMAGFIPFILGDILKLSLGILLAKRLLPIIYQKFSVT